MKVSIETTKYRPGAGMHISTACKEAAALSKKRNTPVEFEFNGITVTANPASSSDDLESEWTALSDQRRRDYEASPEYKAAQMKRSREVAARQVKVDLLIERLPLVARDENRLIRWVGEFAKIADDVGVILPIGTIATALTDAGYKANDNVIGKDWSDDRAESLRRSLSTDAHEMAKYIVGQVLECLRIGMPPHPVTEKFVGEYIKLVRASTALAATETKPEIEGE